MSSLNEIFARCKQFWLSQNGSARLAMSIASVAGVVLIVGVGIWSARPQYVPLATGLAPSETAEIVSKLESAGIDHKMNFAASSVLVAKSKWNQAKILVGDLAMSGSSSPEWNDSVLGDPALNHYKMMRHREQSLARTIERMSPVTEASVHIAQPEPSPFVQDVRSATASIVLELRPGVGLSRETAASIVALVAGSIEGLDPEGVSVMDTRGRLLSSAGGGLGADISGRFEYRRQLETELATKANLMLSRMLGERRAIVRISADLDFTRTQRTQTDYDPEIKVRKSETIMSKTKKGASPLAFGPVGVSSNLNRSRGSSASVPFSETEKESTTEYETASTVDTVTEMPGAIRRLTIAVMADLSGVEEAAAEGDDPATATVKAPQVTREQIEAIVKQAVGFDQTRGDEIEVLITKLEGYEAEDINFLQTRQWDVYEKLLRSSSLGLAAVVALLLGLLIVHRLRPITITPDSAQTQRPDRNRALSEISERIKQNPEIMKAVMSAWLADEGQHEESDDNVRTRKAA